MKKGMSSFFSEFRNLFRKDPSDRMKAEPKALRIKEDERRTPAGFLDGTPSGGEKRRK